jgi:hypothetical protein
MLHHPALYTTHEGVVDGLGVKSRVAHRRGDFLGFYTGTIAPLGGARDAAVAFEIAGTQREVIRQGERDVMGFVNEPPAGARANVAAVPLYLPEGNAVAYYAASPIAPGVELLVHYGGLFARDYPVGTAAAVPRRLQRADAVVERHALQTLSHRYCAARVGYRGIGTGRWASERRV